MSRFTGQTFVAGALLIAAVISFGLRLNPAWSLAAGAVVLLIWSLIRKPATPHDVASTGQMLDVLTEACLIIDEQAKVLFANRAFVRMCGLASDELRGKCLYELVRQDCASSLQTHMAQASPGGMVSCVLCWEPGGSPPSQLEATISLLPSEGSSQRLLVQCRLPAESEAETARAARSNERMLAFVQRLIDVIPEPVSVKDAESRYLMVNDAHAREFCRAKSDFIGLRSYEWVKHDPTKCRLVADEDARVLAGQVIYKEDHDPNPVTGEERHRVVSKAACLDAEGKPVIVVANFNTTRWCQAERALKDALEREQQNHERTQQYIQHLIDVIPYPVYVKDSASRFVLANTAFAAEHMLDKAALAGQDSTRLLIRNDEVGRLISEEDAQVLGGEVILKEECELHPTTGQQLYRVVSKASCRDPVGNAVIVTSTFDVTRWRLAEQELAAALRRETERGERIQQYVQRLIDVIPEPVYVKDASGRLLIINVAFAREHGVEQSEVIGADVATLPSIMRAPEVIRQEDAQVLAGNNVYKEECARSPVSGAEVYRIIAKARCLDAEGRTVIVGTHFNVSLWREAEHRAMKALELQRRTHEFLQSVFDSLPNPLFVLNSRMQHVMVNRAFLDLVGCRPEAVEGRCADEFLPQGFACQLDCGAAWLAEALEGDVQEKLVSYVDQQKNARWMIVRQVCGESIEGERIVLGVTSDITSLREAETRWIQAKEAAERANAAKSEFLANMSHELRTPMHAILSFARLGQERAQTETTERLAGYFERVVTSGERLMGLLDALLDISKLEAGRMTARFEAVDLRRLLEEVMLEHEALLAARHLRFVRHGGEVPLVRADAALLGRVLRNLLSNAIKFSPAQGAIDLYLACHAASAEADDVAGATLELVVADRGVGIPEGEQQMIFDKFVQSSATRSGAGGTGLGLAICKEIVALHGGEIFARSRVGGGAEFVLRVPTVRRESVPPSV